MTPNRKAFLDMLAKAEGTSTVVGSDNGYNVLVGSLPKKPMLFKDYSKHPHIYNRALNSTAAGRYQIIFSTYIRLCKILKTTSFSPATQDAMAIELIRSRGALALIDAGNIDAACDRLHDEWASLPGGSSGQHQQTLSFLKTAFVAAGGTLYEATPHVNPTS